MEVFNGAFPILPGKEAAARAFASEVSGPRATEYAEMQERGGISRETWSFQETPAGAFMLVWFECESVEKAFADAGTATDNFSVWFRGQVKDITGVDLAEPTEGMPELLVNWAA